MLCREKNETRVQTTQEGDERRKKKTRATTAFAYLLNVLTQTSRSSASETSSVAQLRTRAPPSDRRLWSCIARGKSQSFPLAASLYLFFGALAFRLAPYPVPSLSYSCVFWHASRLRFNYRSVFTATTTTPLVPEHWIWLFLRCFGFFFFSAGERRRCRWHQ